MHNVPPTVYNACVCFSLTFTYAIQPSVYLYTNCWNVINFYDTFITVNTSVQYHSFLQYIRNLGSCKQTNIEFHGLLFRVCFPKLHEFTIPAFIKNGANSATIEIKIKNSSPEAYKHEIYGDYITIVRHINASGGSNYKVKTASGMYLHLFIFVYPKQKEEVSETFFDYLNFR